MKRDAVIMAAIMNAPVEVIDRAGSDYKVMLGNVDITQEYWSLSSVVVHRNPSGSGPRFSLRYLEDFHKEG